MEYFYLETQNRFNTYVVYLLTNTQYHYIIKFIHKHTKKRTEFTHIRNTRTHKYRMGKGLWLSYTIINEHNYFSNNERIK